MDSSDQPKINRKKGAAVMTNIKLTAIILLLAIPLGLALLLEIIGFFLGSAIWLVVSVLVCWLEVIPANQVAVISTRPFFRMTRILQPGANLVLCPFERIGMRISTLMEGEQVCIQQVSSVDGVPFRFDFQVVYQRDPRAIPEHKLTETLPAVYPYLRQVIHLHASDSLRESIRNLTARQICQSIWHPRIGTMLTNQMQRRLASLGIQIRLVVLDQIHPPQDFQQELVSAQSRQVEAHSDAKAMRETQDLIGSWNLDDRQTVALLELLRGMRNNSNPTISPLFFNHSFSGNQPPRQNHPPQGNRPTGG
jgi:hypothetical protein